jgi:PAS domain S-box-containing protein
MRKLLFIALLCFDLFPCFSQKEEFNKLTLIIKVENTFSSHVPSGLQISLVIHKMSSYSIEFLNTLHKYGFFNFYSLVCNNCFSFNKTSIRKKLTGNCKTISLQPNHLLFNGDSRFKPLIILSPVFKQKLIFKVFLIIAIIGCIYVMIYIHILMYKRQNKLLEQKIIDRTLNLENTKEELLNTVTRLEKEINYKVDAENKLRENAEIFKNFIEQSSDGVHILDEKGAVIEWNSKMEEILGLHKKDCIGKHISELDFTIDEEHDELYYCQFYTKDFLSAYINNIQNETVRYSIVYTVDAKGNRKCLDYTVFPIVSHKASFVGYVVRDFTEKKAVENQLHEYQSKLEKLLSEQAEKNLRLSEHFSNLYENTADKIAFFKMSNSGKILITGCNVKFADAFELNDKNIENVALEDLVNKEYYLLFKSQLSGVTNSGGFIIIEAEPVMIKGKLNFLDITYIPIDTKKEVEFACYIRDVTENRLLINQLKEREAYLNTILESIPFDFWTIDNNSKFTFLSKLGRKLHGDYIGKDIHDIDYGSESSAKHWVESNEKALQGENLYYEVSYNRNGKTSHLLNLLSPIVCDGAIIGALGLNIDMTGQKEAFMKLKESESKFYKIFNNSLDINSLIDLETGRFIDVNKCFLETTGFQLNEVIGKTRDELNIWVNETDKVHYNSLLLEANYFQNLEIRWNTKYGPRDFLVSSEIMEINSRKVLLTLSKDIHELKVVSKALKESEEKYRRIFDASTDYIMVVSEDKKIIEANPSLCSASGYSLEELKQLKNYFELIKPEYNNLVSELTMEIESGRTQFVTYEVEYLRSDKSSGFAEVVSSLIHYNNKNARLVIARDITGRKRMEQQVLLATVEAEERERQRLAADLHDEVGPLLSSLNMNFSILAKKHSAKSDVQLVNDINLILKEAISTIKEISYNISPQVLTSYGLVPAINFFISTKKHLINITFENNLEKLRLPNSVEVVIFRIVKELFNNTLKHASANEILINIDKNDSQLKLLYKDNGIGFNIEETLNSKNIGLGLSSIIKRINSLSGKYQFITSPGEGFQCEVVFKNIS